MNTGLNNRTYGAYPQMPRQKISRKMKGDKWGEANVDAIDGMATSYAWEGRSTKECKKNNYNLMNSIVDPQDFKYVVDPLGFANEYGEQPGRLRSMNVIKQKIEKLKGDEILRPFDFSIMAVSGGGLSAREDEEGRRVLKTAQEIVAKMVNPENSNDPEFNSLVDAQKSMRTYSDLREQYASAVLKNALEDQRLEYKFSEGFEHGLIVGEEIYYIGIENGKPVVRVVNPLYFEWDKGPETKSIQDAQWCREERYMSVSQIMDTYSTVLTDAQIDKLDRGDFSLGMNRNTNLPGYAYTIESIDGYGNQSSANDSARSSHIRVVTTCWKSMAKVAFVIWTDETGAEQVRREDEDYELSFEELEAGARIEYEWINEVWSGTKIGDDVYTDIGPIPNQMRTIDNPSECKLPYVGGTYNNLNSITTSMVDLCKPAQYMIDILWYRIDNETAKSKGKKLQVDTSQIPSTMSMKQWMYNFDALGILWTNSMEEGKKGTRHQGKLSQNQSPIKDFDMSMSQTVQQYLMLIAKLEQHIDSITGVPQQAEGEIGQYETATGINAAMSNSSTITQSYYNRHDEIKRSVLQQYIEVSKYAFAGGRKINYITGDLERISMEIDGDKFIDSDYNVFPTNANKDKIVKQKIEQLAGIALQQDKANLSDMVKLYKTNSLSEYEAQLIRAEKDKAERDQAMSEQQAKMQQEMLAHQEEQARIKHERDLELEDRKGEWDIRKATVQAAGFDEDKDRNDNGIPDVIEIGADQLEMQKAGIASLSQKREQGFLADQNERDRALKREEMASKERMNKENNETALKNKVVGETKSSK